MAADDATIECLKKRELQIVSQLRELCDSKGREVNPAKSAELLHQLGLVYKDKSPDKICLLQSAALFNAAKARNVEMTDQINHDLHELCQHVLDVSKAERREADLITFSHSMFENVELMRRNATFEIDSVSKVEPVEEKNLEEIKINFIQSLQNQITNDYKEIMKVISDYCIDVLGQPPCPYTHVGLGSLARKEVTPFSDFESVIVLIEGVQTEDNFQSILEYFRWFTVIFQIVILNFGETILPSVAIPTLNDFLTEGGDWFFDVHTPRGICFDGLMPHACKTPLGRQQETEKKPWKTELIKPVSMMISYLSTENDIKNGYHLADILATTCYVSGDNELFNQFQTKAEQFMKHNTNPLSTRQLLDQIKEDLDSFAVFSNLQNAHANRNINTKRMIYRSSTIFVSTLGKLHKLNSSSCFDIISEMEEKNILSLEAAHNLRYAIAVACQVRLSVYMKKCAQSESVAIHQSNVHDQSHTKELDLLKIVGIKEIINYFKITFCIQRTMQRGLKESYVDDMRSVGRNVDAGIAYYLLQYEDALEHGRELRESYDLQPEHQEKVIACTSFIKDCLFHLDRYEEALSECKKEQTERMEMGETSSLEIANCRRAIGKCLFKLMRYSESIKEHEEELKIRNELSSEQDPNDGISECCHNIAYAFFKAGEFSNALEWFQQEKVTHEKIINSGKHSNNLSECLMNIAGCHFKLEQYHDAMHRYTEAKSERIKVSSNDAEDEELAECLNKIGHCLSKMGNTDVAVQKYLKELDILESGQKTAEKVSKIHDCKANIAGCYFKLGKYFDSLSFYNQILGTFDQNSYFLDYLGFIGSCLFELGKFEEALKYHEKEYSGRIVQEKNAKLATCLHHIGCDLFKLNQIEESMKKHQEEQQILQELNDENPTLASASCFNKIATCFVALEKFDGALESYKKELFIRQSLQLDNRTNDEHTADTMHNIASCLYRLGYTDKAMEQLKQALSYREHLRHESV